jgi:hypothetical protein
VLENPGFDTVVLGDVPHRMPRASTSDNWSTRSRLCPNSVCPVHEPVATSWWVYVVTCDEVHRVTQRSVSQNCEARRDLWRRDQVMPLPDLISYGPR